MHPSSETRIETYGFLFEEVAWQRRTLPLSAKNEHWLVDKAAECVSNVRPPSAGEQEQSNPSAPTTISARFMHAPMSSRLGATPTWDQRRVRPGAASWAASRRVMQVQIADLFLDSGNGRR